MDRTLLPCHCCGSALAIIKGGTLHVQFFNKELTSIGGASFDIDFKNVLETGSWINR
jgi:hypothetical protein